LKTCGLIAALRVAVILASLPLAAAAQDFLPGERARAVRMACAAEHQRFCRDVPPGGGRILRCLTRHADLVSQPCFQALTVWGLTAANAYRMCLPDVDRLCAPLPPRSGPALACLVQNADKLSKDCRDSLNDLELLNGRPAPQKGP
jgi:cysteine rich repeat protein